MADKFIDSERFLKLSIVILVALLAMVSIVSIKLHLKHVETELRTSEDVRALEEKLQAIRKASDSEWTGRVESLKGQIQELQSQLKTAENSRSFWTMGGRDATVLKKLGLENPMKDLATDLVDHPELIPYEGTMGGTMRFFGINHTYFLRNGWVIAYFEDGHNSGHMLLRYEVLNNGEIKWKVLHADMSR